jgi:hypothetical protein
MPSNSANTTANNGGETGNGVQQAPHDNVTPDHTSHAAPQTQAHAANQNNPDRYRFSPPVKANDNNYDVHPPLNQNKPQAQPRQDNRPAPSKESKPPKDNKDNNKDNKGH